jgi:hypothetical protein
LRKAGPNFQISTNYQIKGRGRFRTEDGRGPKRKEGFLMGRARLGSEFRCGICGEFHWRLETRHPELVEEPSKVSNEPSGYEP